MENTKESFVISTSSTTMEGTSNNDDLNDKESFEGKQVNANNDGFANSTTCGVSNCNTDYNPCNDKTNKTQDMENGDNNVGCDAPIKKPAENEESKKNQSFLENTTDLNTSNCSTANLVPSTSSVEQLSSAALPLSLKQHNLKTPDNRKNIVNQLESISLNISTTMGQEFTITVNPLTNVENLKKIIAKKFKMTKDRIRLLHREKELQNGSLLENDIIQSSKITVTPNCESGRRVRRPENTLLQALESLSESQLDDILNGKVPLIINMRLGDHVMLIQLQLTCRHTKQVIRNRSNCKTSSRVQGDGRTRCRHTRRHYYRHQQYRTRMAGFSSCFQETTLSNIQKETIKNQSSQNNDIVAELPSISNENECQSSTNLLQQGAYTGVISVRAKVGQNIASTTIPVNLAHDNPMKIFEQTAIKSLSNLVTTAPKTTADAQTQTDPYLLFNRNCSHSAISFMKKPTTSATVIESKKHVSSSNADCDPIAANLTSCLCTRLYKKNSLHDKSVKSESDVNPCSIQQEYHNECTNIKNNNVTSSNHSVKGFSQPQTETCEAKNSDCQYGKHFRKDVTENIETKAIPVRPKSPNINGNNSNDYKLRNSSDLPCVSKSMQNAKTTDNTFTASSASSSEASKNLRSTMRHLSRDVRICKATISSFVDRTHKCGSSHSAPVIESIKNNDRNIYTGKFSGKVHTNTNGRSKRDVSPILHILDDLITAAPQISRNVASLLHLEDNSADKNTNNEQMKEKEVTDTIIALPTPSTPSATSDKPSTLSHNNNCQNNNPELSVENNSSDANKCESRTCTCPTCINLKTKSKMEQLRFVMQQRKEKRQERKMKNAPYANKTTVIGITTETTAITTTTTTATASPITTEMKLSAAKKH